MNCPYLSSKHCNFMSRHTIYRGRPRPKDPRYSGFQGILGVSCFRLQRLGSSVGFGTGTRMAPKKNLRALRATCRERVGIGKDRIIQPSSRHSVAPWRSCPGERSATNPPSLKRSHPRLLGLIITACGCSLDRKNPRAKEDITHLPPAQLAASILHKEQRIAEIMGNIQQLLAAPK